MLKKLKLYFKAKKDKNTSPIRSISPKEAAKLIKEKAIFIDVREPRELTSISYDVKNLIVAPLSTIEQEFNSIPKDKILVVVCRSGNRSLKAAKFLQSKGYQNLLNLEGGIMKWQADGFPTK